MGSGGQSTDAWKKKLATLLAGLSSSQLFVLIISSGNFSVDRFMLPENLVGLYINRIVIAFRITAFIGTLIFTAWVKCHKNGYRTYFPGVSTAFLWLHCLAFSLLLTAYYYGGEKGHIMYYYLGIIFASFIHGSNLVLLTNVAVEELPYYIGSCQLFFIIGSAYQSMFLKVANSMRMTRAGYKLIIGQLTIAIILSATAAIAWTFTYGPAGGGTQQDESSGMGGFKNAWSPILMAAMAFGLQCLVYPAIAPYKIIGMDKGYKIGLAVLFTSAIPPLTHLFLSQNNMGANKPWSIGWHFAWLFILVQVALVILFFLSLHYHDWPLSHAMRNDIWVMGAMTVIFGICVQAGWAIGMAGAPWQDGDCQRNPTMDTVNTFLYTTAQLISVSFGDGYLSTYRMYEMDPDNWPTKHYGTLRAFWFWTWSAIKYACKKSRHAYTSDLRGVILGKKDYLFIVYTDG